MPLSRVIRGKREKRRKRHEARLAAKLPKEAVEKGKVPVKQGQKA
jgi:hypothetical protein